MVLLGQFHAYPGGLEYPLVLLGEGFLDTLAVLEHQWVLLGGENRCSGVSVHPRMLLGGKGGTVALRNLEYRWVLLGRSWLHFPCLAVDGNYGREAVGWQGVVPGCSHSSRCPCVCSRP